ncbi:hypothetical protein [Saccharopolyspora elongata]|uniref:hypothetical protein n=1 Tax=Saccharopolyspora elongata TaxID=2530387 RepID=UPI001A9F202F|nr:hypothetical protein [Saccharopolyspora elongata]
MRYTGSATTWGFAIYRASHDDYENSILPSGYSSRHHSVFRTEQLRQPGMVEEAMRIQLTALLAQFTAACNSAGELAEAARAHFEQHPDAAIITS